MDGARGVIRVLATIHGFEPGAHIGTQFPKNLFMRSTGARFTAGTLDRLPLSVGFGLIVLGYVRVQHGLVLPEGCVGRKIAETTI